MIPHPLRQELTRQSILPCSAGLGFPNWSTTSVHRCRKRGAYSMHGLLVFLSLQNVAFPHKAFVMASRTLRRRRPRRRHQDTQGDLSTSKHKPESMASEQLTGGAVDAALPRCRYFSPRRRREHSTKCSFSRPIISPDGGAWTR